MHVRIFDLDGGVMAQHEFVQRQKPSVISMQDWGPAIRICCSFSAYERFERECLDRRIDNPPEPAITFCGSGDFHHVTLAMLHRIRELFNLLILDKHPDWVRGAPLMHCGTWVSHVLKLPLVQRVFHLGADLDLDNWLQPFAPWRLLHEGRIKIFPAQRRLTRGEWSALKVEPMRPEPSQPMDVNRLENLCSGFRTDLARRPLYISIDKDLLRTTDAVVNWDSGQIELTEVQRILTWFIRAAGGRIAGVDIMGDWSQSRMQGLLRNILQYTEHPAMKVQPSEAAVINGRTNQALVETIQKALTDRS